MCQVLGGPEGRLRGLLGRGGGRGLRLCGGQRELALGILEQVLWGRVRRTAPVAGGEMEAVIAYAIFGVVEKVCDFLGSGQGSEDFV